MELRDEKIGQEFMVNGQRIKHYTDDVSRNSREAVSLTNPIWVFREGQAEGLKIKR